MSDELDDLLNNFDELSQKAKEDADEEVGRKIAAVTRMNKEEVKELFPEHQDQEKLAELMKIVKSADAHNTKVDAIISRAEEFSGIVVKLLGRFV